MQHFEPLSLYVHILAVQLALGIGVRDTAKHDTGDSAVTRSMAGVHEVMISNDARIYVRSVRSTYPDTIGGIGGRAGR